MSSSRDGVPAGSPPAAPAAEARADVRSLFLWAIPTNPRVLVEAAWEIQDRYRFCYWDALIVASPQASGCRYLLSGDLVAGQVLDGLSIVDPFTREPPELGLE
ncbi:MAG: hypothetical protein L6R30_06085 [Thermoanaerobaculia bacterium]|nr:hypothetical protein [Thermoanaerobaculia bacterium]